MNSASERALVICPGRGTYNASELGYLARHHSAQSSFLQALDHARQQQNLQQITDLDRAPNYDPLSHAGYQNAPSLIYTCAMADYLCLSKRRFEPVAATGNSMGWYIALAVAGAVERVTAFELISTMGALTGEIQQGGQLIYPLCDDLWMRDETRSALLQEAFERIRRMPGCQLFKSIDLGSHVVLAGNNLGLNLISQALPKVDNRYPLRLAQHAAFHTPLMRQASESALQKIPADIFLQPELPLIDGQGRIWDPQSMNRDQLRTYTLGNQVVEPYDFAAAIRAALLEFAPNRLVLLGPGTNLTSVIGQIVVEMNWEGLKSKQDFLARQEEDPVLLAFGNPEHRVLLTGD